MSQYITGVKNVPENTYEASVAASISKALKDSHKDKHFAEQMQQVFAAFKPKLASKLMVCLESGILRANICQYVAVWKKHGCMHLKKQGICPISKYKDGYYTTDTNLFSPHPKLF